MFATNGDDSNFKVVFQNEIIIDITFWLKNYNFYCSDLLGFKEKLLLILRVQEEWTYLFFVCMLLQKIKLVHPSMNKISFYHSLMMAHIN